LRRLELCAAYDGVTLIDLLEGLADDLELQQQDEPDYEANLKAIR
jgi:hypothetical protein